MYTNHRAFSIAVFLVVYVVCLIPLQLHAQTFGRTQVTVDNVSDLTLMATYNHMSPPIIALSPDGRWLAVARSVPEGGSPGAGEPPAPYHRPFVYYDSSTVLIYDMQNLVADPQVLSGNNQYVKQMLFTDTRLLLLTSDYDEDQRLQSWQIEGDTFVDMQILIEVIDTAFAVNKDDTWIVYFRDGAVNRHDWSRNWTQLGEHAFSEPILFPNAISLAVGTAFGDNEDVVAVDQDKIVVMSNLDSPTIYHQFTNNRIEQGIGSATFIEGSYIFADQTTLYADIQVATLKRIDTSPMTLIDYDLSPSGDLVAAIVSDGQDTTLTLWDITDVMYPNVSILTEPDLTIPRDRLSQVLFSPDGSILITVAGFEVAIWSLPENLLTPNAALTLSQQNILAYCNNTTDDRQTYPLNSRLGVVWSWYAADEGLVRDHIYNADYNIRIDRYVLEHWVFVTQIRNAPENDSNPTVYFYAPLNDILSARDHHISYELTWLNPISDGYEDFGAGTENPDNLGECYLTVTE